MSGQVNWQDAGSEQNAYVVKESIARGIYYKAAMNTLFGKLNGPRELKTQTIVHDGGTKTIDAGNDSPVFQKSNNENNKALFTLREPNKGMATYGDADVKPGEFAEYMHTECNVRTVSSPAYPLVGFESADNFKRVVAANQLASVEKDNIARWQSEECDLDGFRALLMGASRGILSPLDGGMGVTLNGATVGQERSPLNTLVAGNDDLTPTNWNATTHNTNLANRLLALNGSDNQLFTYETHLSISYLIDQLSFKPVKVGGRQFRAIAVTDEWNIYMLRKLSGELSGLWRDATPRSDKNPAIYSRNELELDGILYIPAQQLRFFRPSVSGSIIAYGSGMNADPRASTFRNTSNIMLTLVMGAGALLRGTRASSANYTTEHGRHGKGLEIAYHYQDGWRRADWYTRDERQQMMNDSLLAVYNWGKSPMAA